MLRLCSWLNVTVEYVLTGHDAPQRQCSRCAVLSRRLDSVRRLVSENGDAR